MIHPCWLIEKVSIHLYCHVETLLLSLSSKSSRQFVVVKVTIAPFTITLLSPMSIENTTSHPLTVLLRREDNPTNDSKKMEELRVQPFSSIPLPFHFCIGFFTLQVKPESFAYSTPLLNSDIPSDTPRTITAPPLPQFSTFSTATSWNAHIRVSCQQMF